MQERLYIIGNGFDLHHNLATSYYDFSKFLKNNNSELFYTLESYIYYPTSDKDLWSKFEENLANLDVNEILSDSTDALPNYTSEEFRDRDIHTFPFIMEEQYQKLTSGLFNEFKEFILNVVYPASVNDYKVNIEKDSTFLTFNYTDTLERLYNVKKNNIVYIHNSAYDYDNEIILGHAINPSHFEEKKEIPPDGLNEDELQLWYEENDSYDYSYNTGKETLMKYFKDTFKTTLDIIEKHKNFFESLNKIEEIYILGHSISLVDLAYFQFIVKSVNSATKWLVSYYNFNEKDQHLATLKKIGIKENKITFFELADMKYSNNQITIDFNINHKLI
jgi:hypothetical protein